MGRAPSTDPSLSNDASTASARADAGWDERSADESVTGGTEVRGWTRIHESGEY